MAMGFSKKFSFISYIRLYLIFFFALFLHRVVFWFVYATGEKPFAEWAKAWWLGTRFDIRLVSLFFLLSFIVFIILNPFFIFFRIKQYFYTFQKIWFSIGLGFMLVCTWVDFGNYSYLEERLSSKIFALLSTPDIALGMVMQSYPIAALILGFLCLSVVIYLLIAKVGFVFKEEMFFYSKPITPLYMSVGKYVVIFLLLAISIHSKFSQYPLRWSEAYFSRNTFLNQFSLNPIQNVYDTYKFNKQTVSEDAVKSGMGLLQSELVMDEDPNNLLLVRQQTGAPILPKDVNVVVIMMESLASFKIGHFGNPYDTTPYLDQVIKDGLLFDNFHVIKTGTAASIFCFLTGIPDLNEEETASRNPLVVDQHTMINNLKDHSKFYFIGGSANWGNIRGIIQNNIYDLKLYEEGMFKKSSLNDIWGISDLELFEESHKILEKETKPFFAFIQTAGYHKPYTIPKRTEGFESKTLTNEQMAEYGFFSNEEYNSLRFSDHALGYYFNIAKDSEYFKNTVFVIYADHGLRSYDAKTLSDFYNNHKFPVHHIPLVFYSPLFDESLRGQVNSVLGYQPDILPTIMSMMGETGPNSTFGLDLLSEEAQKRSGVFLAGEGSYPAKFFDGKNIVYSSASDENDIKVFQTEDFEKQLYHSVDAKKNYADTQLTLSELDEESRQEFQKKAHLGRSYYYAIKYKLRNNQKAKIENKYKKILAEQVDQEETEEEAAAGTEEAGKQKAASL